MKIKYKKIAVFTSGGDAPGMNAAIRGVVRTAMNFGIKVYGINRGYEGMIDGDIHRLTSKDVSGVIQRGGTFLYSARSKRFRTVEGRLQAYNNLISKGIEAIVAIGGDGTFTGASIFNEEFHFPVVGIPGTIDNDIFGSDFTIGYDTALNTVIEAIDKIKDTAGSHNRLFFVEVMGRDAGWIALHSAIAGGAEVCLIPEMPYSVDSIMERVHERIVFGRGFLIIVIAEGAMPVGGNVVAEDTGEVGYAHKHLGGAASRLKKELKDAGCETDVRVTILGHLQRGGIPSAYDRILATQFGVKAMEMVLEKNFGEMVAYKHPNIVGLPIKEVLATYNRIGPNDQLLKTARGIGMNLGD